MLPSASGARRDELAAPTMAALPKLYCPMLAAPTELDAPVLATPSELAGPPGIGSGERQERGGRKE